MWVPRSHGDAWRSRRVVFAQACGPKKIVRQHRIWQLMCRFPRCQRIRKSLDFARFRSPGARSVRGGAFVLKSVERAGVDLDCGSAPRIGIITSRKIGNAVKRNGIRRIFREVFRLNVGIFGKNRDYLFIAMKGICAKSRDELRNAAVGAVRACNFTE
jgi:ribonuclease P protein component